MTIIYSSGTGAGTIVRDGWDTAQGYASNAYTEALEFLDDMADIGNELTDLPTISADVGNPATIINPIDLPTTPTQPDGMTPSFPAAPEEPTLTAVTGLSLPDAPVFSAQLPNIDLNIAKPAVLTMQLPVEPDLEAVPMPAEPSIVFPDVPTLESVNLPATPVLSMPVFSASAPEAPMTLPDATFAFTESSYVSDLLTALKSKLLEWVNGAATGIDPDVEQAVWDRGRAKEDAGSVRALDAVRSEFAARGFSMPPGAMLSATQAVVQEAAGKASSFNRDVAIKQAELEQANRHFAFQQSWQVESGLLTYANQVAQRAFDLARFTVQAGIDVFNATVNRYSAQVQAYNVEAAVFKSLIEAELAKLEVFKAELEGQKLVGQINLQSVEIYKTRVESVKSLIEIYKDRVNATRVKAEINKTLIDAFGEKVRAYGSAVQAKAAEYDAYGKEIQAEVSKADVFKAQADAYQSQVAGYGALVTARVAEKDADIKINQEIPLEIFKQRAGVFGQLVQAESARIGALSEIYRTDGQVYQAAAQAQAAKVGAESDAYKAESQLLLGKASIILEGAKANLQKMIESVRLLLEAMKAGAQVSAQLAASSLSSVNLSGSISDSSGFSLSSSVSESESTTHTYSHTVE